MAKSIELREKRANLIEQAREVWNRQENESRELTQEERNHYDKLMKEVDSLKERIDEEERLENLEAGLEKSVNEPVARSQQVGETPEDNEEEKYRNAFWKAVRYGKSELESDERKLINQRSLNIGTDAEGGYTVPDEFERQLIDTLADEVVMRSLATVRQSGSGDRQIPVISDHGTAAWLDEEAAYSESDITYDQKLIGAHKLGRIIKVSEEFLQDSYMNVADHIRQVFGRTFGEAEENAFVQGNGTGKPEGVLEGAEKGLDAAATDAITSLELIELYHSLRRPYRPRAAWLASDNAIKAIRELKDSNDQFIWQPGLQGGEPDRILGRPVYVSDEMPDLGASNKPIAFGDYSNYWIMDRRGVTMQRLNELYAENGQVGFRMRKRTDGKLVLPESVKYILMDDGT